MSVVLLTIDNHDDTGYTSSLQRENGSTDDRCSLTAPVSTSPRIGCQCMSVVFMTMSNHDDAEYTSALQRETTQPIIDAPCLLQFRRVLGWEVDACPGYY